MSRKNQQGDIGHNLSSSSTSDPLFGPRLKIQRAKSHLNDLKVVFKAFVDSKPYELVTDTDPSSGDYIVRMLRHKCIPSDFNIIAGDVIHNARSSLDQMVCALVKANNKQVIFGNGFPIATTHKKFKKSAVSKLKNLSIKADRFIRRLKPHKRGNYSLWLLHELDILDKHNALITVATGSVHAGIRMHVPSPMFQIPGGGFFGAGFTLGRNMSVELTGDNCEIYRHPGNKPPFPHEIEFSIAITLGKTHITNHEPLIPTLESLVQLVERIINIVERKIV